MRRRLPSTADVIKYLMDQRAFEWHGIEFIDENDGGSGVRLRKRPQRKG